jgi:glycosyltransferase involved in cell wall biosynthesis
MISVVVPTCDRPAELVRCLDSLDSIIAPQTIVVNNSDSGRGFRMGRNRGNVVARNIGLANAAGDIVVFLDDDSEVGENFFNRIRNRFSLDPKLGLIACRVIDGETPYDPEPDPEGKEVPSWTGCGGAVRRSLCDGFSEDAVHASAWEWELVAQVKSKGYTVKTFDDIYVRHSFSEAGGGATRGSRQKQFEAVRVPLLFWRRYFPQDLFRRHAWRWAFAVAQATVEQRTGFYLLAALEALRRLPGVEHRPVSHEVAKQLRLTLRFKGR